VKKFLFIFFSILASCALLTFLMYFEGSTKNITAWWMNFSSGSDSLPFSAYKMRRENASKLRVEDANHVEFFDAHLFWKGQGAIAVPKLDKEGNLNSLHITNKGVGYSNLVKAKVLGCNSSKFKLEPISTHKGKINSVLISETHKWSNNPLVFIEGESKPFTGTAETKFPSGQIIEEIPYLKGKLHGNITRFNEYGIPKYSKKYKHGRKDGTHIYWFPEPLDPDSYIPEISPEGDKFVTLWSKVRYLAKKKYGQNFGSHKSNKWMVEKYRLSGGDFRVKLLEHWKNNLKHGLFEGFDQFGNKTFKDEYFEGRRIKHKTFDKTKG